MTGGPRKASVALAAIAVAFATACAVPVATDLDEADANQVMTVLGSSGLVASKSKEPEADGHFRVEVPREDARRAEAVLAESGLPRPKTEGVLDALDTNALVPSRAAEHARLLAGVAGDLERSLNDVDGVLSARVHLAVSRVDPLALDEAPPPPSASVLIRYRGEIPPLSERDVQRLVAFAVPGLSMERVAVVSTKVSFAPPTRSVRVGPLSTTPEGARAVRLAVAFVALLGLSLVGCLLVLWMRLRQRAVR